MPASVDSKPLTLALSPLDATLTKNRGEGVSLDADAFRKKRLDFSRSLENHFTEGEMTSRRRPPGLLLLQSPAPAACPARLWQISRALRRKPSSLAPQFAAAPANRSPGKRTTIRSRWYSAN